MRNGGIEDRRRRGLCREGGGQAGTTKKGSAAQTRVQEEVSPREPRSRAQPCKGRRGGYVVSLGQHEGHWGWSRGRRLGRERGQYQQSLGARGHCEDLIMTLSEIGTLLGLE